jgi:hypothetical protein
LIFIQGNSVVAQREDVNCPPDGNGKIMWGIGVATKNYKVKVCDLDNKDSIMIVSRKGAKSLILQNVKASGTPWVASDGKRTYQILGESVWYSRLGQMMTHLSNVKHFVVSRQSNGG